MKKTEQMPLNNNDIFKKLRVAHKLRDDDIVKILKLVDFNVTKSELGALFRNENHPKVPLPGLLVPAFFLLFIL